MDLNSTESPGLSSLYEKANRATNVSNRYAGLNVRGLLADLSACGGYRLIHPLTYLNNHGANCQWSSVCNMSDVMEADIIIAQRQYDLGVANNILWEAKRAGKLLIFECDDNLHQVLPSSPVFGIYHQGTNQLRGVQEIIAGCHGLTVSTEELAGDYSKFNPNTQVLRVS